MLCTSSHARMWEVHHKGWVLKNLCFQTVVFPVVMYGCESWSTKEFMLLNCALLKTLESPLDSKSKPVNPKGNQLWISIGRIDAEAVAPILWPPDEKSQFIGKDSDAGEDWRQEKKGTTEGEMAGWHHRLNGHESEQTLGDSEGQGSLACCSPWGCRVRCDLATGQQQQMLCNHQVLQAGDF